MTNKSLYKRKKLKFIPVHKLTATDTSKTAKITKRDITHQHITVEFYLYPTVSTALIHSVKPKLDVHRIRYRPTQSIWVWLTGLSLYLQSDRDKTLQWCAGG